MKRLLITGASGFLGSNFCHLYADSYELHAVYHTHPLSQKGITAHACDLTDSAALEQLILEVKPDGIIHLAAYSEPNKCQLEPEISYRNNVQVPEQIARLSAMERIPFVVASTDLVFDGQHAPYSEEDAKEPVSIYGQHKSEMEEHVLAAYPQAVVCRLPLMYGIGYEARQSFLQPILRTLEAGERLSLFADEFRTAASARDVCRGLLLCLEKGEGIYHLGGDESLSRYKIGELICEIWGFDKALIQAGSQKDVVMPAPRPADVSLTNHKAKALGWQPGSLRQELSHLYREYRQLSPAMPEIK